MLWVGQRQWWDRESPFGTQAQHFTAGHEHPQFGTGLQQFSNQWRCSDQLLKVVEQEQNLLIPQRGLQQVEQRPGAGLSNAQRLSNGKNDEIGIDDGSQWDEVDTISKVLQQFRSDLQR